VSGLAIGECNVQPMAPSSERDLARGYSAEVDAIDECHWCQLLQDFEDATIYQSWPYADVTWGRRHASHLVLRQDGNVAAIAQVRVAKLPFTNVGIAYVQWGPVWRRDGMEPKVDAFRQAIRALRNEFVCKRGLVLRLFPMLFEDESPMFPAILSEEGFLRSASATRSRTILMDLAPPLERLREGMMPHWKRELRVAERNGLEVVEGSSDELFAGFIRIYREMVSRKKFAEPNDINQFRTLQDRLPETLRMKIMLCRSGQDVCAGLVCSAIGKTAIYLFGATSNAGMKSRGSYLLHWNLVQCLKQNRVAIYNLNGINPQTNPGTYRFKNDLGGRNARDVYLLGKFDSHSGAFSYSCVRAAEALRARLRSLAALATTIRAVKGSPKADHASSNGDR
jgi:lipid II:glycine glycyltransferase (peptidoglycan interpeptide bridge formation enzyme)